MMRMARFVLDRCKDCSRRTKMIIALAFGSGYVLGLATAVVLTITHWE